MIVIRIQEAAAPTTMTRKFSELTKGFSPERHDRIEAAKAILRDDMELTEQREALSPAQSWDEGTAER